MRRSVATALVGLAACVAGGTPRASADTTVMSVDASVPKLVCQSAVLLFNPSFHTKRDDKSVPPAAGVTSYDQSVATHVSDPGGPSVTGAGNINEPNVVIGAIAGDSSVRQQSTVSAGADTVVVESSATVAAQKTSVVQNCCFAPIASASTAFSVAIVITRRCRYQVSAALSAVADDPRPGVFATFRLDGAGPGGEFEGIPNTFIGNGTGGDGRPPQSTGSFAKSGVFEPGTISLAVSLDCDLGRIDATTFHQSLGSQARASWRVSLSLSPDEPGDDVRWTRPSGGAFGTGSNWDTQQVPQKDATHADNAIFDLHGRYTVDFGAAKAPVKASGPAQRSDRLEIRSGDVTFENANLAVDELSLERPSLIVDVGSLTLASGQLTSNSATIGDLQSVGAKVAVAGTGSLWSCQGRLRVGGSDGSGGDGELSITNGGTVLGGAEVRVGAGGAQRGVVRVDGPGSGWATGNIAVGYSSFAEFDVSSGARVTSGEIHIGLSPVGSLGPICGVAGTDADGTPSEWDGTIFRIGPNFGIVDVSDGGFVKVGDVVLGAGKVEISGIEPIHAKRSRFECASLTIGDAQFDVLDGGSAHVTSGQTILGPAGVAAFGSLNVKGTHPAGGVASSFETDGELRVGDGDGGVGFLGVADGAVVNCRSFAFVAAQGASRGSVLVSGGSTWGVDALLGVGGEGVGEVLLDRSTITAVGVDIAPNSSLAGTGTVVSSLPVIVRGSIDPGVVQVAGPVPAKRAARSSAKPVAPTGGTLTIQGDLVVDPAGTIRAEAAGTQSDRLVVTGAATLDGTLVLQFKNGFAPKTGDHFELVHVNGTVTGAFASVETRGLAPGAQFAVTTTGGAFTATATNDAVAMPTVSVKASAKQLLEKRSKKKATLTFARKGSTTSALTVSYRTVGSASNGFDYVSLPGTVTIPAKKKSVKIALQLLDDPFHEGAESIDVAVVPGADYTDSVASAARIAIVDND